MTVNIIAADVRSAITRSIRNEIEELIEGTHLGAILSSDARLANDTVNNKLIITTNT